MLPDGTGYFMDHGLPALTGDATYQLWAKVGDASSARMVSLGVLGADPGVAPFRLATAPSMFEITREPAAGSPSPGDTVVMRGVREPDAPRSHRGGLVVAHRLGSLRGTRGSSPAPCTTRRGGRPR